MEPRRSRRRRLEFLELCLGKPGRDQPLVIECVHVSRVGDERAPQFVVGGVELSGGKMDARPQDSSTRIAG